MTNLSTAAFDLCSEDTQKSVMCKHHLWLAAEFSIMVEHSIHTPKRAFDI